ncbi:MAG: VIT1/CCC1 transporter family protein [Cyclobacteriaceae bacterium]|nr:VIT1/CCC1 transporter family protein [Cyclobacteriaceae bacterium]
MSDTFWKSRVNESAVLSPVDRISEILFGLIMVLTFTGAISVSNDGRQEVRDLLWAALGCNVAWGLVDAIMYGMNVLLDRGHAVQVVRSVRAEPDTKKCREQLRSEMQPGIAALISDEEVDKIAAQLKVLPEPSNRDILSLGDLWSGIQIFLLVFLCTLPVALPFAFIDDLALAMRASNGVALLLLFIGGFRLARYAGFRPWLTAITYSLIGVALVSLTMALGG